MRGILVIASLASFVLASAVSPVSAAEPYILNLSGNNFSIKEAAAIGQELEVEALLSQVHDSAPIPLPGIVNWSTEYTLRIHGLFLVDPPANPVKTYVGGTIELWSQAPPNAPWTPTTPISQIPAFNGGQVPATFVDGQQLLVGSFTQFATLFFGGQTGTVTSTINWTGGSRFADLQALGIDSNWHWNGFFNNSAPVPSGYRKLYGGKLEREVPVSVNPATWGRIKNLLRAD